MPVHDLGYRNWEGAKSSRSWRWFVITQIGVRVIWRNQWLRRIMLAAWIAAMYVGMGFFAFERYVESFATNNVRSSASVFARGQRRPFEADFLYLMATKMWDGGIIAQQLETNSTNPAAARHAVWSWLLMWYFRYPQGTLMLLVVGMIAPPLIARDVRSRAFLLYFSRPLSPLEYLLGKACILWCYLGLLITLPALVLYLAAISLSNDVSVVLETWDLPLRVLAASVTLIVPTSAVSLLLSSLTSESRFAAFAWFTLWALGYVAYGSIYATRIEMDHRWSSVSLYHTLGNVQRWIFGMGIRLEDVWYSLAILVALTAFASVVLMRRVSAPIRV